MRRAQVAKRLALLSALSCLAVTCPACSDNPAEPTGSRTTTLCHRVTADVYLLLTIPVSELNAHLLHADGWPLSAIPGRADASFNADCDVTPFGEIRLGFGALTINGAAFVKTIESGFTTRATVGLWEVLAVYGRPAPSIIFRRKVAGSPEDGEVTVRVPGIQFAFTSVDIYSSLTPIPYRLRGQINGADVWTIDGTVPNTFGQFATVAGPDGRVLIDTLIIRLTNPVTTECCTNPVGIDNVILQR